MREIKFRVWDGKKMWMPETLTNDESQTNLTFFNPLRGIKWGLYDSRLENRVASGEHHQLMQYTGYKDKNGKEICEADILQCFVDGLEILALETVEFKNGCFILRHRETTIFEWETMFEDREHSFEIIGNIYDNPKLIK